MPTVLITGNLGYIGPVMTRTFKNAGYSVVGLDTDWFKDCCFFPLSEDNLAHRQIYKDIRYADEHDLDGIDAVVHLAGLSNDPLGELNPQLTGAINLQSTLGLARLCKKMAVKRFVFASSCSVYGIARTGSPITEEGTLNPITAYAKAKIDSEFGLVELADRDFHPVLLRNATVYGVTPKVRLDLVVNNLTAYAYLTKEITILSDGTPWRPIVHVDDFCRAFLCCVQAPAEKVHAQAFNVGDNSQNFRVKDIAEEIAEIMPQAKVLIKDQTGSDERSYRVDFSKIRRVIPEFQAKMTLQAGIRQLIEAYSTNGLSLAGFNSEKFFRVRTIKSLIAAKRLDINLEAVNKEAQK